VLAWSSDLVTISAESKATSVSAEVRDEQNRSAGQHFEAAGMAVEI
jgi:hypothetical protein